MVSAKFVQLRALREVGLGAPCSDSRLWSLTADMRSPHDPPCDFCSPLHSWFWSLADRPNLEALDEHKYRPGPYTPLDLFLYRTWWKPFSEFLPRWLAPNALTLIGMSVVVSSAALLVVCSPSLVSTTPAWGELLTAFLLIVYQTCDACDGLQARRTGASSPLGELLDRARACS